MLRAVPRAVHDGRNKGPHFQARCQIRDLNTL
jgi:hypothetical protein